MSAEATASRSLVEHQQTRPKRLKRTVVAGGATVAAAGIVLLSLGLIKQAHAFNRQEATGDNQGDIALQEEQRPLRNNPDSTNPNNATALGMIAAGEVVVLAGITGSAIILRSVEKRERRSAQ